MDNTEIFALFSRYKSMGSIVFLSGPPSAGKSKLIKAVHASRHDLVLRMQGARLNIYTDRPALSGENRDGKLRFRTTWEMDKLSRDPDYFPFYLLRYKAAYSLKQMAEITARQDAIGLEKIESSLISRLTIRCRERGIPIRTVFLTPFTGKELGDVFMSGGIEAVRELVTDRTLLALTMRSKGSASEKKIQYLSSSALFAFKEMRFASAHTDILHSPFDPAIRKTDDPFTWTDPHALIGFAEILEGGHPSVTETNWPGHLFQPESKQA